MAHPRPFSLAALALCFLAMRPVCASEAPGASPTPAADSSPAKTVPAKEAEHDTAEPKLTVTMHSVLIGGEPVKYKATAGYLVLKDETDGKPEEGKKPGEDGRLAKAKIFFVAYTREDTGPVAKRPITFSFNGGPGAASVWLHLGALGPRRVKLPQPGGPPYSENELLDNDSSWLDLTDLVFIDPVSTGYSRAVPGESAKPFHAFQGDIKSIADFIRLYTTRNDRWLSPKFVVGESYGGTRAAALSAYLQDTFSLYLNGIVIVSGLLNWQTIETNPANDEPYLLYLPTYAAAAWYHKRLPADLQGKGVDEVRKEAEEFAAKDYLLALARGSSLPDEEKNRIARRVADFTALPLEFVKRYHMRIPPGEFMQELLKPVNRSIGRFDDRFKGIGYDPDGADFDPSFEAVKGHFTAAINQYLRDELKFETDLPYETLANVSPWSFGNVENRFLDVSEDLGKAMSANPHLKVWVACGYYDMAIPYFSTQYVINQMPLDPSLRENIRFIGYPSGHMIYNDEACLPSMKADFKSFLRDAVLP